MVSATTGRIDLILNKFLNQTKISCLLEREFRRFSHPETPSTTEQDKSGNRGSTFSDIISKEKIIRQKAVV